MMNTKYETNETAYLSRGGWEHGEDERVEQEMRMSDNSLNITFVKFLVVFFVCTYLFYRKGRRKGRQREASM